MALETATYLDSLNVSWPLGSDAESTSDDHHRLVKACLLRTFPNINGEVRATPTVLNYLTALTGDVQAQIDNLVSGSASAAARIATLSASVAAIEADLASKSARIVAISASVGAILTDVASKSARMTTMEASISAVNIIAERWSTATLGATTSLSLSNGIVTAVTMALPVASLGDLLLVETNFFMSPSGVTGGGVGVFISGAGLEAWGSTTGTQRMYSKVLNTGQWHKQQQLVRVSASGANSLYASMNRLGASVATVWNMFVRVTRM